MVIEVGDKIRHPELGQGVVIEYGATGHPRFGPAYIVRFEMKSHNGKVWCVFEDEITLIGKGENNE